MPEPNLLPSSHRLLPAGLSTAPVAALRHGLSMRPGLATLNNHSRSLGLDTSVGESESEDAKAAVQAVQTSWPKLRPSQRVCG